MPRRSLLLPAVFSALLLTAANARAVTPEGIVYESEAISGPKSAWRLNRGSPDHWTLWTTEQNIDRKRSGHAVLVSPAVQKDRATPEDGAPPLHSMVNDLPPGTYRVYVSPPGRPLAYSLDGRTGSATKGASCFWARSKSPTAASSCGSTIAMPIRPATRAGPITTTSVSCPFRRPRAQRRAPRGLARPGVFAPPGQPGVHRARLPHGTFGLCPVAA